MYFDGILSHEFACWRSFHSTGFSSIIGNGGNTMDILYLVDRLENLIASSRRMPVVNQVMIKEGDILNIVDQMRTSIPDEIKQARRIIQEKERILAQAQHREGPRKFRNSRARERKRGRGRKTVRSLRRGPRRRTCTCSPNPQARLVSK